MTEQLINEKLDELNSITDMETGRPTIPVKVFLQEAEDLLLNCNKDKEELVTAGLVWTLTEDLSLRIDALRVSQSKWVAEYKSYHECQEEWKIASPLAFNLRDELVHHFYHALFKMPNEYAKVRRIADGGSNADMIQDLSDLAELGSRHTKELQAIGFDLTLLETARSKSFELAELLAKVNGTKIDSNPAFITRNKAYIHLKEAVDEIRRVGQYVFWRNEVKFEVYSSNYYRNVNDPRRKKTEATES